MPSGARASIEEIVAVKKIKHANASLRAFTRVEEKFLEKELSIFNARIDGLSFLQYLISVYEPFYSSEKKEASKRQRCEVIEHVLKKVTSQQLNEFVETSHADDFGGIYFGTAVAFAAINSPWCLSKILAHPLFDPTNFVTKREYPEVSFFYSETPASCLALARDKQSGGGEIPRYGRENAHLLVEMLENDARLWPNDREEAVASYFQDMQSYLTQQAKNQSKHLAQWEKNSNV
jgi:hypothetical protein